MQCWSGFSKKQNEFRTCIWRESYFKELAYIIIKVGECKVCTVDWWTGDLGKS